MSESTFSSILVLLFSLLCMVLGWLFSGMMEEDPSGNGRCLDWSCDA